MNRLRSPISLVFLASFALVFSSAESAETTPTKKPVNKLLYMYRLFYLPFNVAFHEGNSADEILPFASSGAENPRLLTAQELVAMEGDWKKTRDLWRAKSLLQSTPVPLDKSARPTPRIASHRISLTRSAFDHMSISERVSASDALKSKPENIRLAFRQSRFLRSFMEAKDEQKFNLFVVSPSWCRSSREYRILLESYLKRFPQKDVILHSVVVDDPKEKIFEAKLIRELFPNSSKYSHDNFPKFIALENVKGKTLVHEEGEALRVFYDRFVSKHQGFLKEDSSAAPVLAPTSERSLSEVKPEKKPATVEGSAEEREKAVRARLSMPTR